MFQSTLGRALALSLVSALVLIHGAQAAESPTVPAYQPAPDFFQFPEDLELAAVAGVAFTPAGEIIVTHRGAQPVLVFDANGRLLRRFGFGLFPGAHGTRIAPDGTLWITDMRVHTVHQFNLAGEVLRMLGESKIKGDDDRHFNRPTDVAFAGDGSFFVADGYGNSRVVKFDGEGRYVRAWGEPGKGPGQFHLPHGIIMDRDGLLHVADRENDRIQVFDQNGNYQREYGGFAPFGLFLAGNDLLYVADGRAHEVLVMTLTGKILSRFGKEGAGPGEFRLPHGIGLGPDGALYVTEIEGRRIQRFVPVK